MMIFSQLNDAPCKTYLIANQGLAILVDPVLEEFETYLRDLDQDKLFLRFVVDTHVHADHISGAAALRDRTGADYVMHERSASPCANKRVRDGEILWLGDLALKVLHTPGHTKDSICLLLEDRILTGDFLFIGQGGGGRTDLPGGDPGEHWDSLAVLEDLPDELLVFPGHDYHGRMSSTLGEERVTNPRLQKRPREEYVDWLNDLRLGAADWMTDVIHANYACTQDPRAAWVPADSPTCEVSGTKGNVNTESVDRIYADELARELASSEPPILIDVRQADEFNGVLGHIDGALLIPVGELPHRLEELEGQQSKSIVTVCRSGGRSDTAASILKLAGFANVRSLEGGMLHWRESKVTRSFASQPMG